MVAAFLALFESLDVNGVNGPLVGAFAAFVAALAAIGAALARMLQRWLSVQSEQLASGAKVHVMPASAADALGDRVRTTIREELRLEREWTKATITDGQIRPLERRVDGLERRVESLEDSLK